MNQRFNLLAVLPLVWAGASNASIEFSATAFDQSTNSNQRVESVIPNPFGPAATAVVSNPSTALPQVSYSYAEFDLLAGKIRLRADDSGNQVPGAIFSSANLNHFSLMNNGPDVILDSAGFKIALDANHYAARNITPLNTAPGSGEKKASISYSVVMQIFDLGPGPGSVLGTIATQSRMDAIWNEDGSFKEYMFTTNNSVATGGFNAVTGVFDSSSIEVELTAPNLLWGAGRTWDWRSSVTISADASDAGLDAYANALSTAQFSLTVPEGIEFLDVTEELGPLGGLSYVTVQTVPLPGAGLLLPTGLVALFGYSRRRRARQPLRPGADQRHRVGQRMY